MRHAFFGRVLQVTSPHRRQLSSVIIVGQAKWPRPQVKKFSKCNNKCSKREETHIFHCCDQSAMMKLKWYVRYQTIDYDSVNLIFLSSSMWLHIKGEFFLLQFLTEQTSEHHCTNWESKNLYLSPSCSSSRLHQLKQAGRIRQVRQHCCTCVTFFGRYMYEYTICFKVTDLVQIFDPSTH